MAQRFLAAANANGFAKVSAGKPENRHKFGRTLFRPLPLEQIASKVAQAKSMAVGIKPEGQVRWLVVDIDRKVGSKSPYWDERGRNLYTQSLIHAAELAGCRVALIRSSTSKGLHLWILLPEMVHVSRVHHIGQELVARAGMVVKDGSCELFPSEIPWSPDPRKLPESKGIRLPGGHGSALITADGLVDDPCLIYEALQQALEQTVASQEWIGLMAAAEERCQTRLKRGWEQHKTSYVKRPEMPGPWTGSSQSNYLTGEITKVAMAEKAGQPDPVIVAHAIELITNHPGYQACASAKTKREVASGAKVTGWMLYLRRRAAAHGIDEKPRNSEHNQQEQRRVRGQLLAVLREHGEAALALSQRWWKRASGIGSIHTVRKWWGQLGELLQEVMHTPPIKALHHEGRPAGPVVSAVGSGLEAEPVAKAQGDGLDHLAVGSELIKSLDPVPPVASAELATCGANVEERSRFAAPVGIAAQVYEHLARFRRDLLDQREAAAAERERSRLKPGISPPPVKAVAQSPIKPGLDSPLKPGDELRDRRRSQEQSELLAWLSA